MDRHLTIAEIEQAIDSTMRDLGVDRGQAEVIVAMTSGELHGDLLAVRPLSPEQRQKRARTLREAMADLGESADNDEKDQEAPAIDPAVNRSRKVG
jgi:hypothetical protein